MSEDAQSLMSALGFSHEVGELYGRLLALGDRPVREYAQALGLDEAALDAAVMPLEEAGIVARRDGALSILGPVAAVTRLLAAAADNAQRNHQRMLNIARAMPYIAGTTARPPAEHVDTDGPLDGEIFTSDRMRDGLEAMALSTVGEVRWLRPDRFEMAYDDVLNALAAAGRRVRTIYPVHALSEAPTTLAYRAKLGEEIRVIPDVTTRLMVLGTTHAIVPEPLGLGITPRLMLRQHALVELCTRYFEELWARARPVSSLSPGEEGPRKFLLEQLARGASDDQIARRLGLSLRTVRRRMAELMDELGAESRFQAGVEAARRGWL